MTEKFLSVEVVGTCLFEFCCKGVTGDTTYEQWYAKSVDNSGESGIINTETYYAGLFGKNKKHKGNTNKERFEKVSPDFFETLPRLSSFETPEQAAYNANIKDYQNKCQKSVSVWELRMRGFDIVASNPVNGDDLGYYAHSVYYNANWMDCITSSPDKEIEKFLIDQGDGSRIAVSAYFMNGGHMFSAMNDKGTVKWLVPLTGESNAEFFFQSFSIENVRLCRIDNVEFSNLIKECIE